LGLFVFISFLMKQSAGKEELLVVGSIFAFFVGLVLQGAVGKRHGLNGVIKKVLNWSVIPFFFVSTGIHFELSSIAVDPATLIIVVFVAFAGKLAGPLLVKPLADFSWAQLHLAGWAMNSRGALELALALVAFRTGLIHVKLYSGLIVMALVTTLVFPFVVTGMIRRDPSIMD
jgi:Kef-type K+ transport system membrane component KefB